MQADSYVRANVGNKLQVIVEQIRFLQAQAEKVLSEAKRNNDIHHVTCNCKKIPGNMYHMYERPDGQRYMSMISPKVCNWLFVLFQIDLCLPSIMRSWLI